MKKFSNPQIAIIGATGAVGTTMLSILEARGFPASNLRLMASARSAGTQKTTRFGKITIEDLETADPTGIDIALFSAGGARSKAFAPKFVAAGATVIDNSSAFRMQDDVPLVVANVNDDDVALHTGIIANPNCTTMALLMAVGPLHEAAGLKSMIATSYQSVSGSGQTGIGQLCDEVDHFAPNREGLAVGDWTAPSGDLYQRPIAYNVLPLAGSITEAGHTDEEWKLVNETKKILGRAAIDVEPTCVRVPVMVGHGIAATLWFDRNLPVAEARELLAAAPGLQLWDDAKVPTPLDSAGIDDVLVGRVRETLGVKGGISLFAVGDNLRKGAALNAVEIAERLID
jgi:aspartate-semialdehyde dehydrogenase